MVDEMEMSDAAITAMVKNMAAEMAEEIRTAVKNLKTYDELSAELKEEARRRWPSDYKEREYKTAGVEIEFSAK